VAHAWDFRSETKDSELMKAIMTDYRTGALAPADRALCDYAMKLTLTPSAVGPGDVDRLRGHGFSDRAIHDAVQVIAFFNYVNRVADGLGVDLEPEMPQPLET
jgi:uncharacterized peroxidase-related enzyme